MQQGLVGETIGGGYRIDAEISGGNMGMVYCATQLSVDRRVALKVIDQNHALNPRSIDRFFQEARVISKLEHPHIVRLYDFGRDESHDLLYLVMEFIDGPTLNELLRTHRFKPQLVIEIGIQICRALIESHAKNVVHRDLKPANILLSRMSDGSLQLKVVDFGVARALETLDKQLTAEGAICGTPRYMPPEQARHGGDIDGRADLYALGLILYEMLCGYPPFDAEDAIELIFKHIKEEPRPLSTFLRPHELDGELDLLTHELLRKAPSERPGDALTVLRRFEHIRTRLQGQEGHPVRLEGQGNIYTQLTPWMLPAVQEARAALVFGHTGQVGSDDVEMEPLETEWDHTHTVRVDLKSMLDQQTRPFVVSNALPPLSWGAPGNEEATIPPDPFDALVTQVTPSREPSVPANPVRYGPPLTPVSAFTSQLPGPDSLAFQASDNAHLSTLLEEDVKAASAPAVVAPILAPPRIKLPSRNRTLSDTLQSLFPAWGGKRLVPAALAENTAENMFLSTSEEELSDYEARAVADAAATERLLFPVMLAVLVCVIGVIGFVLWRSEREETSAPEVSRLDVPLTTPQVLSPDGKVPAVPPQLAPPEPTVEPHAEDQEDEHDGVDALTFDYIQPEASTPPVPPMLDEDDAPKEQKSNEHRSSDPDKTKKPELNTRRPKKDDEQFQELIKWGTAP